MDEQLWPNFYQYTVITRSGLIIEKSIFKPNGLYNVHIAEMPHSGLSRPVDCITSYHQNNHGGSHCTVIKLNDRFHRMTDQTIPSNPVTTCYPLRRVQTSFASLIRRGCTSTDVSNRRHKYEGERQQCVPRLGYNTTSSRLSNPDMTNIYRTPTVKHRLSVNNNVGRNMRNRIIPDLIPKSSSPNIIPKSKSQQTTALNRRLDDDVLYHSASSSNIIDKSHSRFRTKSLPNLPNPILKRPTTTTCKSPTRRACFKQQVDICYFDAKDRPHTTKDVKSVRFGSYIVDGGSELPARSSVVDHDAQLLTRVIRPDGAKVSNCTKDINTGITYTTDIRLIPCVDGRGIQGKLLRLNVRANAQCVRERTIVKALSGGGAVIIHLFQNEADDGGSAVLRQHIKKLILPVTVDPYKVKAHIHRDGMLTIEAPIVDSVLTKT